MRYPACSKIARSGCLAAPSRAAGAGRRRTQNEGALRMRLWLGPVRRVCVAVFLLGTVIVTAAIGAVATAQSAAAQQIVVQGNRRVEASTITSYFQLRPGERLDDLKINNAYKSLVAT